MKKFFKKSLLCFFLVGVMVSSLTVASFAHQKDNLINIGDGYEIESNNRFSYETIRTPIRTRTTYVSTSQAKNRTDANNIASVALIAGGGPPGLISGVALLVGNAVFDMNIAGKIITSSTLVERYKIHRITKERYLEWTKTELDVKVYAMDIVGYSLHRSFSFSLTHK